MTTPEEEVVLEEKDVKAVFERLARLRSEEGKIPPEFLEAVEEEIGDPLFGLLFEGPNESSAVGQVDAIARDFGEPDDSALERKAIEPTAVPFAGCFDPNRYFEVFDLVRLERHHRLDYVYEFLGNSGQPLLYTRKDEHRIQSPYEYAERFPQWESRPPYLEGLSFDRSALGFFQFALFCVEAPKFYLYWHSGYYDLELVCASEHLRWILLEMARSEPVRESDQKLLESKLRPRVRMKGDSAEVSALSFTKWGGFFTHTSRITWPNRLQAVEGEKLVADDCGVIY